MNRTIMRNRLERIAISGHDPFNEDILKKIRFLADVLLELHFPKGTMLEKEGLGDITTETLEVKI